MLQRGVILLVKTLLLLILLLIIDKLVRESVYDGC